MLQWKKQEKLFASWVVGAGDEIVKRALTPTPEYRSATPDDITKVVAFLCSPAASMIPGQVLVIEVIYSLLE